MKKFLGLIVLMGAVATLSACGSVPKCYDELDECNRGGAYTEERTAVGRQKVAAPATPAPVIEPAPAPAPEPAVKEEPAPAPVVTDVKIMTDAEPMVQHIAK